VKKRVWGKPSMFSALPPTKGTRKTRARVSRGSLDALFEAGFEYGSYYGGCKVLRKRK
jgi:hypothetical protein